MNIPNKMDDLGVSPFQETSKWDVFVGKKHGIYGNFMGLKRDIKNKNQESDIWVCLKIVQPPSTKIMINLWISRY
jgi:hypothetical protein